MIKEMNIRGLISIYIEYIDIYLINNFILTVISAFIFDAIVAIIVLTLE